MPLGHAAQIVDPGAGSGSSTTSTTAPSASTSAGGTTSSPGSTTTTLDPSGRPPDFVTGVVPPDDPSCR